MTVRVITPEGPGVVRILDQGVTSTNSGGTVNVNSGSPQLPVAYTHRQTVASDVWRINHSLGFYPNVTAFDTAGDVVEGEIVHLDTMRITLIFSIPLAGEAYLS